ncbi:DUF2637 domain-containing protein [Streptomyces sp. FxanaA7]|uniref:DUF2637 domain-containing protein n=1 Tax=Streptomyces sp. FxanaA7 TaxID=1265492 RepID=UPI000695CC1A|nr:DUF2637 domain-containing protein [Streptomyces sp. FxanaA7]
MTSTPAGHEPNRPTADGPLAPTAPGTPNGTLGPRLTLTRPQKLLIGFVIFGAVAIAAIGFIGSYTAVTQLAYAKGFGAFSRVFTLGIDLGIGVFLALDLLLTWLRMPYPALRYGAWLLTAATIAFNAVVSWPDPVGVGMHAVIPILFVVSVEAARHAIGRMADITADRFMEGPPASRWFLNPIATFILWRRQRLWAIRKWDTVLELEQERRIYIAKLRKQHGRWAWRRKATAEQALVLSLAKDGMSVAEAIELPAREEAKRLEEESRIARQAERAEYERRQQEENERLERERKALELEEARQKAERDRQLAEAQHQARIDELARQQRAAAEAEDRRRREEQLQHARLVAEQQERAAAAAKQRQEAEEAARVEAERKEAASRRAADAIQRAANATASPTATSRPASPANASASATSSASASRHTAPANPANRTTANGATSPVGSASATASQSATSTAATAASGIDIQEVVAVYQLLNDQLGKAPSDQKLGEALGVSRSRAQQLRTAAIDAGHTELAKPVRLAS